jgi:hypothetical protein
MKGGNWPMQKGHLDHCDHTGRQQVTSADAAPRPRGPKDIAPELRDLERFDSCRFEGGFTPGQPALVVVGDH